LVQKKSYFIFIFLFILFFIFQMAIFLIAGGF